MSKQDFLVELGTEELPPKALLKLSKAFTAGFQAGLTEANLEFGKISSYATPRRLAVVVESLSETQPDSTIEKVGPAVKAAFDSEGSPTKAASGFARSCGVDVSQLEKTTKDGIEKLFFSISKSGAKTADLLPALIQNSLDKLPIPKRMRWGASRTEFVRPVHWCVLMYGSKFLDTVILGVKSGNNSYGHRFHFNKPLELSSPAQYETLLKDKGYVIADFDERKELIRTQVLSIASEQNATAVIDEALLDEVTALVEYPVALTGEFDKEFLEVPAEALILAMKSHQKYFHLLDSQGKLLPRFISVSNIESRDPAQVVAGNEKVIRPRLADARFFYDTDLKSTLESQVEKLKSIVFQDKLGTVFDKSERVARLAEYLANQLGGDAVNCKRAAMLAKCDLLSNMVNEFADLQGLMGYYYALNDGEPAEVATAIVEQYQPRFSGDQLPQSLTGSILSLAEKLDTIAGLFAINQPPTGSKDPFAIRRAALGVLRILVENEKNLDLRETIDFALSGFPNLQIDPKTSESLFEFFLDRFRAWYGDKGIAIEVFQSVRALAPTSPLDFDKRVSAVHKFSSLEQAKSLASANKRVGNLIAKSGEEFVASDVDISLFENPAEEVLYGALQSKEEELEPLVEQRDYESCLVVLSNLREPVDTFFDDVLVMSEDQSVKNNRLQLLYKLRSLFLKVADVSLLHTS